MAKDKDYIKLIHTSRWVKLRRDKLTANPCCQSCEEKGIVRAATEVHHIRPVEYGLNKADKERLMFDYYNLQSLCHECHVNAHIELGKGGRKATARTENERLKAFENKYLKDD